MKLPRTTLITRIIKIDRYYLIALKQLVMLVRAVRAHLPAYKRSLSCLWDMAY